MTIAPGAADQRIAAIDGLRAVAVVLVVAHHLWTQGARGGFIGVDIFFVISGFVITGALLRQNLDLRQFYLHRFFRIVPAMVPVIVFALACTALGVELADRRDALLAIMSLMNWARALELVSGRFLTHFWSLAIEEQFYLLWPLMLGVILRYRAHAVAILSVVIALGLAWQIGLQLGGASYFRVYNGTDTRFSQLMIGCLVYFVIQHLRVPGHFGAIALATLLVLAFIITADSDFYLSVGIGLTAGLSALVVMALAQGHEPWQRPLLLAPVQWIGSRSYAIYLWHFPLIGAVREVWHGHPDVGRVLVIGLTLLAAEASMQLVERPARNLRLRFERRPLPQQLPS